jgi:hypothetical protein
MFVRHATEMADGVVAMFLEYLLPPGAPASVDPATWAELGDAVARLRPLAATSVASAFDVALTDAAERAAEHIFEGEDTTSGTADGAEGGADTGAGADTGG